MNTKHTPDPTIVKALRVSIITSICIALCTPLIVTLTLYFPYITGKAYFMRSFILLAAVLYTMLATIDKTYRPRKSVLMYSVLGFMAVLAISCFNSVNPIKSFWSNFERMEGLVTLLYMGALFIISASVIKKREWTWVMNASLAISVAVGMMGLQDFAKAAPGDVVRLSGTLGNSSYLGVYALIHIFLALLGLLMIYRGKREEELLKSGNHDAATRLDQTSYIYMAIYAVLAIFNTYIMFNTGTRGSFVGLVIGLLVTSGFLAIKERNKILRFGSMGVLAAVFLFVVILGTFKNSDYVAASPMLSRFGALITTDIKGVLATQGAARTTLWRMAYQGVKEKPMLGWGQDTFGYVFAKHYDPAMYQQEQWFDRSHNVFMDWLISAGVLGLIGYLLLFVTAIICLFSSRARLTVIEKSILMGLLAAYFIHNLFVFDNLSTYVLFFVLLGYIHDRYTHDRVVSASESKNGVDMGTLMIAAGFFAVLCASYIGYKTIYQPYAQNAALIDALRMANDQSQVTKEMLPRMKKVPMDVAYEDFVKVFSLGHTGEVEGYEQLMNVALGAATSETVSEETKIKFIELFQNRIVYHQEHNAADPRFAFFASNFYSKVDALDPAIAYAKLAYDLSPQKQSFAYSLAVLEYRKGNIATALQIVKKAYEDAPLNSDAFSYYVSTLLEEAKTAKGTSYDAVKLGGIAQVLADGYTKYNQTLVIDQRFWDVFMTTGHEKSAKLLANRLAELIPEKKAEFATFTTVKK
ncbi:MAG: O-antigen ligase family protein [Patescibacteria group bacterium]